MTNARMTLVWLLGTSAMGAEAGAPARHQVQADGVLRAGPALVVKLADLVVFAKDLFALPPRHILSTPVDPPVAGGRVVFER